MIATALPCNSPCVSVTTGLTSTVDFCTIFALAPLRVTPLLPLIAPLPLKSSVPLGIETAPVPF